MTAYVAIKVNKSRILVISDVWPDLRFAEKHCSMLLFLVYLGSLGGFSSYPSPDLWLRRKSQWSLLMSMRRDISTCFTNPRTNDTSMLVSWGCPLPTTGNHGQNGSQQRRKAVCVSALWNLCTGRFKQRLAVGEEARWSYLLPTSQRLICKDQWMCNSKQNSKEKTRLTLMGC